MISVDAPVSRIATYTMLIALCLLLLPGIANASASVSIVPSSQTVGTGEDIIMEVHVKPDTPVAALQFDLEYDNTLITINSIEEGDFFANSGSAVMFNPGIIDEQEGTVSMIYSSIIMGDTVSDEGVFCTIQLTTEYNYGPCELRLTNVVLGDENGQEVPAVTFDSIISIAENTEDTERNDNDERETDLNIIPANDEGTETAQDEQQQSIQDNEEDRFASTEDTGETGSAVSAEADSPEFENTGTSNWTVIIFAAVAFFAVAYFLDRK
ncbi:Cohesin domain-containing protein [Methanolobus profundi]|uniref:Cohesin domain-containing protein n=2 Tax=Methanolobus profundi TaxID=487685 RepID=A0A1I4NX20_9EURY|nr:Cohesin domain-containing protein [Methanolobus profundi]